MTVTEFDAREAARFMETYAKQYHAGAFAMPTGKEIAAHPSNLYDWRDHRGGRVLAYGHRLTRDSNRKDFTGRPLILPRGTSVLTHLARSPDAGLPDLSAWDTVFAYREDPGLDEQLRAQKRSLRAVRITASSELIGCWGLAGTGRAYPDYDRATRTDVPGLRLTQAERATVLAEVGAVTGWADDFPFYSDGSWSALSLRGYWREDPTRGVKPAEMPRNWRAEHPSDLTRTCEWTTLADRCPRLRAAVEGVQWWPGTERVRLLRMAGRNGRGGALARHTDITDRAAGLADGQIARFHLPLVTNPAITMTTWELDGQAHEGHLVEWRCYYLDARKPHAVSNPTGTDRIHLVVDVIADAGVRECIAFHDQL